MALLGVTPGLAMSTAHSQNTAGAHRSRSTIPPPPRPGWSLCEKHDGGFGLLPAVAILPVTLWHGREAFPVPPLSRPVRISLLVPWTGRAQRVSGTAVLRPLVGSEWSRGWTLEGGSSVIDDMLDAGSPLPPREGCFCSG